MHEAMTLADKKLLPPRGTIEADLGPPAELLAAIRELIRLAVKTLVALQDPDAKYLGWARMPMHVVHEARHAYGRDDVREPKFRPNPKEISQMEFIGPWLAWLRREEGDRALRRIMAWSMNVPMWKIGQREGCSDRTVMNRIDRSIAAIVGNFVNVDVTIEVVDEPHKGAVYAAIFEKPPGPHGGEVILRKVYVSEKGFMKGGRKMRSGIERYDQRKLVVDQSGSP